MMKLKKVKASFEVLS